MSSGAKTAAPDAAWTLLALPAFAATTTRLIVDEEVVTGLASRTDSVRAAGVATALLAALSVCTAIMYSIGVARPSPSVVKMSP